MTDLDTLAAAVRRSDPASDEDRAALDELAGLLSGERLLRVSQVAELLGVRSPTTVRNWLEHGYFPGAQRTAGGHRRFRLSDVLAMRDRIEQIRSENASGELIVPDCGNDDPYAR